LITIISNIILFCRVIPLFDALHPGKLFKQLMNQGWHKPAYTSYKPLWTCIFAAMRWFCFKFLHSKACYLWQPVRIYF